MDSPKAANVGTAATRRLLLVDYENVHHLDLSVLDETYTAIVFVGARQERPKAASQPKTAHRFARVAFQKVHGPGGNALDFYIACELGRVLASTPTTECFVLSRDKGFDPLLFHLRERGLLCHRFESISAILEAKGNLGSGPVVCLRCGKSNNIEHHGGRWCSTCGHFASPPDPALLPSNQPGYRERAREDPRSWKAASICGTCGKPFEVSDGIYDDGEWMCGGCVAGYALPFTP